MTKRRTSIPLPAVDIHWHRPKAKNTDITVTDSVVGYRAIIPVVKGGSSILVHKNSVGKFTIEFTSGSRDTVISMGELEAIAIIYAKLQETK